MNSGNGTALVTGGAKGIGFAVSAAFLRDGYDVLLTGRDEAALRTATGILAPLNPCVQVACVAMDVTSPTSVTAAFEAAHDLAPLRVLVNNAGVIVRGSAHSLPEHEWSRVLDTDLTGPFRCAQYAYAAFDRREGAAVVNIASIAASVGISGRVAYTASKAGVEGLTRTLALEWATEGIRVNTVAPGWTRTEMVQAGITAGALDEAALTRRVPLGRLASPEEIAEAALFLGSPRSAYITGQTLVVDGGFTINGNS